LSGHADSPADNATGGGGLFPLGAVVVEEGVGAGVVGRVGAGVVGRVDVDVGGLDRWNPAAVVVNLYS